jgi:hypothetical protein
VCVCVCVGGLVVEHLPVLPEALDFISSTMKK